MLRYAALTLNQNKNVYVPSCNRYLKPEITFKPQVHTRAEMYNIKNSTIVREHKKYVRRSVTIKRNPGDVILAIDQVTPKRTDIKAWKRGRFVSYTPNNDKIIGEGVIDSFTYKLPANLSSLESAVFQAIACAMATCRSVDVQLGDHVLILGCGPIGLSVLLVARAMGAKRIIISDTNQDRLDMALKLGAARVVLADETEASSVFAKRIITEMGGMPNRTIDCCGSTETAQLAVGVTMPGGICIVVGNPNNKIELPVLEALSQEVRIKAFYRSYNNCVHTWCLPLFGKLFFIQQLAQIFLNQMNQKFLKQPPLEDQRRDCVQMLFNMTAREAMHASIFSKQLIQRWQQKQQEVEKEFDFITPSRIQKIKYVSIGDNRKESFEENKKEANSKFNEITRKQAEKELAEILKRKYKKWAEKKNIEKRTEIHKKIKKLKTTITCKEKGNDCGSKDDFIKKCMELVEKAKNDKCKNNPKDDDDSIKLILRKEPKSNECKSEKGKENKNKSKKTCEKKNTDSGSKDNFMKKCMDLIKTKNDKRKNDRKKDCIRLILSEERKSKEGKQKKQKSKPKRKTKCIKLLKDDQYRKPLKKTRDCKPKEKAQSKEKQTKCKKCVEEKKLDQLKDKCKQLDELMKFKKKCAKLAKKEKSKQNGSKKNKLKHAKNQCQCRAKKQKCAAKSNKCQARKCKGKPKKCQRKSKRSCKPKCNDRSNNKCKSKNKCNNNKCNSDKNNCDDNKCS